MSPADTNVVLFHTVMRPSPINSSQGVESSCVHGTQKSEAEPDAPSFPGSSSISAPASCAIQ